MLQECGLEFGAMSTKLKEELFEKGESELEDDSWERFVPKNESEKSEFSLGDVGVYVSR